METNLKAPTSLRDRFEPVDDDWVRRKQSDRMADARAQPA
jgi:hypothetical protein